MRFYLFAFLFWLKGWSMGASDLTISAFPDASWEVFVDWNRAAIHKLCPAFQPDEDFKAGLAKQLWYDIINDVVDYFFDALELGEGDGPLEDDGREFADHE